MKYRDYLFIILVVVVLVLFQTSFFAEIFGANLNPNLILVLMFAFLFADRPKEAYLSAFIGGLLIDTLGTSPLGVSSLYYALVVLLTLFAKKFIQESKYFQGALLVAFYLLYSWLVNFNHFSITLQLLGGAFLTLILAYSLYFFLRSFRDEDKYL